MKTHEMRMQSETQKDRKEEYETVGQGGDRILRTENGGDVTSCQLLLPKGIDHVLLIPLTPVTFSPVVPDYSFDLAARAAVPLRVREELL